MRTIKVQLFQKLLGKKVSSRGIIALSFSSEGIALAISQFSEENKPVLIHCEFIHTNNKHSDLKELSKKHQLDHYDCYLVLASDDYRLITIEAPAVTEDELSQAIQWKISDLVEFEIEDAVIDYYPLPRSKRTNSDKMLEVIASPKSAIQPLVDLCIHCGLQLKVIDIQETCLRNLASLIPENERGVAILHLLKSDGRIIIEQQSSIYLNRKLAMGSDRLGLADDLLNVEQELIEQNGLALEIQRSFDYVESYYGLPPISGLAVLPLFENTQEILNILNKSHGITARVMDLSTIVDGDVILDDKTQSLCAPVIGATLRDTTATL